MESNESKESEDNKQPVGKASNVINGYSVPSWAGKPSVSGLHLDVVKEGKLVQKVLVDEKKIYFFGRNPTLNDICIDHSSCSRVHAVLVFHKILERFFLVDLGSTHGTFIGSIRLEAHKPTQLPAGSEVHFGASTRMFILREKPQGSKEGKNPADGSTSSSGDNEAALPDDELELDNLTEFNTTNNKRISTLGITDLSATKKVSKKRKSVVFREEEDIINPEDIDPSVGKFRNLVQSAVIPSAKRIKTSGPDQSCSPANRASYHILRPDHTSTSTSPSDLSSFNPLISNSLSLRLGINLSNPAPLYDDDEVHETTSAGQEPVKTSEDTDENRPEEEVIPHHDAHDSEKKKKYAKEAWPGRLPTNF